MTNNYKPLDLSKIKRNGPVFISSKEALKDVAPINWSEKVLSGQKKVIIKQK